MDYQDFIIMVSDMAKVLDREFSAMDKAFKEDGLKWAHRISGIEACSCLNDFASELEEQDILEKEPRRDG